MEGAFRIKNPSEMGRLNSMGCRLVLILGGHTKTRVPMQSLCLPRTDRGLSCTFCLGHVGATSSFLGAGMVRTMLDVSARLLAACAGTGGQRQAMSVCLLPRALHLVPATGDHQHLSTSTQPPHPTQEPNLHRPADTQQGAKLHFKAGPFSPGGETACQQQLGLKAAVFLRPCLASARKSPGKGTFQGQRTCFLMHTSSPLHLCKGHSDGTQGCWAAAPKPQQPQH